MLKLRTCTCSTFDTTANPETTITDGSQKQGAELIAAL